MNYPTNPLDAVTHQDPYPYYETLHKNPGLYYDEALKLWVASSAVDIEAVLNHPACRVRPITEPVPKVLLGSTAASVFGNLVRMNDNDKHKSLKKIVSAVLDTLSHNKVLASADHWGKYLYQQMLPNKSGAGLTDFCYNMPVYVVGDLLGIPNGELPQVSEWVGSFIRCIAPGGSSEQIACGQVAAEHLQKCMMTQLEQPLSGEPYQNFLRGLQHLASQTDSISTEQVVANSIGLLTQTYEATAGLISNALLMLSRMPELHKLIQDKPELIPLLVRETIRYDPSIQNTRRFVAEEATIAGKQMRAGDVILVVVAAANRDPSVNPTPSVFNINRGNAKVFTFGSGSHVCPGQTIAITIATSAVRCLLDNGLDLQRLVQPIQYRTSLNARVAELEMI
jgi:cytochrome P450